MFGGYLLDIDRWTDGVVFQLGISRLECTLRINIGMQ